MNRDRARAFPASDIHIDLSPSARWQSQSPFGSLVVSDRLERANLTHLFATVSQSPFGWIGVSDEPCGWQMDCADQGVGLNRLSAESVFPTPNQVNKYLQALKGGLNRLSAESVFPTRKV